MEGNTQHYDTMKETRNEGTLWNGSRKGGNVANSAKEEEENGKRRHEEKSYSALIIVIIRRLDGWTRYLMVSL